MTSYMMTDSDIQEHANIACNTMICALGAAGLLTRPTDDIAAEYGIVIVRKGTFGGAWDRALAYVTGKEPAKFVVVRRVIKQAEPANG